MKKRNLYQIYSNTLFKKYMPNMVRDHKDEYALYFVTFTFENQLAEIYPDLILEYFKAFYQKINQMIVNRPSKNGDKKAKMILVPERSHHCMDLNMNGLDHYHDLKWVRHDNSYPENEATQIKTFKFDLVVTHQKYARSRLRVHSVDAQVIPENDSDIFKVCSYMTKKLGCYTGKKCNFNLSDIRKVEGNNTTVIVDKRQDKDFFDESDVLLFSDISNFKLEKYGAKRISTKKRTAYDIRKDTELSAFGAMMKEVNNDFLDRFYAGKRFH